MCKAQCISEDVEKVSTSFTTGISDVAEAYASAIQKALADKQVDVPHQSVQEKAKYISSHLKSRPVLSASTSGPPILSLRCCLHFDAKCIILECLQCCYC